ncbi:MAG TPA: Ig-like domain-containing protein [Gemmatimonadales bacterium]|nr:Ig-like domain-containing protein [Gemmatimonadales bacterium]
MRRSGLALLVTLAGCARILAPPGGPNDRIPPSLISTRPDSLESLPGFKGEVEFRFDEVVSEGGTPNFGLGTGDLERLVVLSPSYRVPVVKWKRNRITVRPREGWKPNTVYRVELLAGLADLSNNRSKNGRIVAFTTGAALPNTTLRGMVVDWNNQRPLRSALVQAIHLPDSLPYNTISDSLGRFELGPVPDGEYVVYGVLDQNTSRTRENRESFDSIRVAPAQDSVGELWVHKHDSTVVRLSTVALNDSLSLALTFSQQLNPYQRLPPDSVEVRQLPDSTPVPVLAILPKGPFDTAYPPVRATDSVRARADSLKAIQDSARADSIAKAREAGAIRIPGAQRRRLTGIDTTGTGPLRSRPALFDKLYVRTGTRLKPGTDYVVVVHGIQNLSRVPALARAVGRIPVEKPPPDSLKARADSLKAKPDTLKVKPDTLKARPDSIRPGRRRHFR